MSKVTCKSEEISELEQCAKPSQTSTRFGFSSMHHNIGHFTLRFQRSRTGIINCLEKIKKEEEELLQLKKRKKEMRNEFRKLRQFIRAENKRNQMLEEDIKKEKVRIHLLDANIAILKAHKNRVLKMQEITKKEFCYMNSAIESVRERNDKDLTKYYDVVINKKKLENENKKLREDKNELEYILKCGKHNNTVIIKDFCDLATTK